jgi:chitin disaccharide deacetylase
MQAITINSPSASATRPRLSSGGALIVNADDWGRDALTTDRTRECVRQGTVSSVSAMVWMADSQRSAAIAQVEAIDTGLHLNLTTSFTATDVPERMREHQQKIARYLRSSRFASAIYHPGLRLSFEYVVAAQIDEYERLYELRPFRIDGHHHMHLSANVLMAKLLPEGTVVRRSFSFRPGEKSLANRTFRRLVNATLARRHRLADLLFALPPMETTRVQAILRLAATSVVEVECHPVNSDEYAFLTSRGIVQSSEPVELSSFARQFSFAAACAADQAGN